MIIVRRGETFEKNCTWSATESGLANLEGVTVLCDAQTSDKQYHPVTVNVSGDFIHFTITAPTDTWALGGAEFDFRLTVNGKVKYTQRIPFEVEYTITRKQA